MHARHLVGHARPLCTTINLQEREISVDVALCTGIALCMAGTVCNAAMMTTSGRVLSEKLDVLRLTFYTAPISCACLLPVYLWQEVRACCHDITCMQCFSVAHACQSRRAARLAQACRFPDQIIVTSHEMSPARLPRFLFFTHAAKFIKRSMHVGVRAPDRRTGCESTRWSTTMGCSSCSCCWAASMPSHVRSRPLFCTHS